MCDRKQAYFDSPCSSFSEELLSDVSLDESLSESDESLESDEELLLVSDEAELDSASGRAGAVDSAFSASETFFFNDSGTGIIPSFTIYWRHWRMPTILLEDIIAQQLSEQRGRVGLRFSTRHRAHLHHALLQPHQPVAGTVELLAIHPLLLTPLSSTHARAVPPHEGLAEALVLPTGVVQQLALGPELAGPAHVVLAQRYVLALRLTPAQQTHLQFHHHLLLRSRHLRTLLRLLQTARLLHRLLRLLLLRNAFLRGVVTLALFPAIFASAPANLTHFRISSGLFPILAA